MTARKLPITEQRVSFWITSNIINAYYALVKEFFISLSPDLKAEIDICADELDKRKVKY